MTTFFQNHIEQHAQCNSLSVKLPLAEVRDVFQTIGGDLLQLFHLVWPIWTVFGMLWYLCEQDLDENGSLHEKMHSELDH